MLKAAKDLSALMMGSGIGLVFGVLTTILLARFLGPQLYGDYQIVLNIVWFFVIVFSFGLDSSVFYFSSKEKDKKEVIRTGLTALFVLGLLGSLVLFIVSPLISILYPVQNLEIYLRIMCLEVLFYGVFLMMYSSLNGLSLFKQGSFMQIGFNSLRIPLIVLPATIFGIMGAMAGRVFDWIITMVLGLYLLRKFLGVGINKKTLKKFFSYGLPIYISTFFVMLNNRFPILYLGKFGGFDVGVFSSAFLIYGSLAALVANFNRLGVQRISAVKTVKEKLVLYKKLKKYVILFSSFVLSLLLPFSSQVINIIFGPEYSGASLVLQIMVVALFLSSIIFPTKSLILGTGKTKLLRNFVFIQMAATIVIGVFLIENFQLFGASLTILLSSITELFIYFAYERKTGLGSRPKIIVKSIISGGLMVVSVALVNLLFDTYFSLIIGGLFGTLVFTLSSIKLGVITKYDFGVAEDFMAYLKFDLKDYSFWKKVKSWAKK